jgi:hypothetical protein
MSENNESNDIESQQSTTNQDPITAIELPVMSATPIDSRVEQQNNSIDNTMQQILGLLQQHDYSTRPEQRTNENIPVSPRFGCIALSGLSCVIIIILGLAIAIFCYNLYSIIFLANDWNKSRRCNSQVSKYVLVSLLYGIIFANSYIRVSKLINKKNSKVKLIRDSVEKEDIKSSLFALSIVSIGFLGISVWGYIISYDENCSELTGTNLLLLARTISIIHMCLSCVTSCCGCVGCIVA